MFFPRLKCIPARAPAHTIESLSEFPRSRDYLDVREKESGLRLDSTPDEMYRDAVAEFGPALDRLARAYEPDPERRRDLLQEIHFALWRSFEGFNGRCSLRTWIYRVAHNTATSQVLRRRRAGVALVSLEEVNAVPAERSEEPALDRRRQLERLSALIRQLKPLDRQIIVSYLEGMDAEAIAEITGISSAYVATKVHRIKDVLSRNFHRGDQYAK
jgi:RNA polymerase sigma-70 factor (ECF subfamily)